MADNTPREASPARINASCDRPTGWRFQLASRRSKWLDWCCQRKSDYLLRDAQSGRTDFLTTGTTTRKSADASFSPDGRHVAWMEEVKGFRQL
ncbi:hypothetical protein KCP74_05755 [Salmonella enterica subsp. enterica]|nr:hypothetical protein KCP74_05755 [Salmonella enterica subsp. enterica]